MSILNPVPTLNQMAQRCLLSALHFCGTSFICLYLRGVTIEKQAKRS